MATTSTTKARPVHSLGQGRLDLNADLLDELDARDTGKLRIGLSREPDAELDARYGSTA